jgi:hypothetical protein
LLEDEDAAPEPPAADDPAAPPPLLLAAEPPLLPDVAPLPEVPLLLVPPDPEPDPALEVEDLLELLPPGTTVVSLRS